MRRASKTLLLLTAAIAVLVLLAALAGLASLRSERVRRAILARANDRLETSHGLSLGAERFSVRPLSGRLEATAVTLGEPGAPPFLEADRVSVSWRPWSLVRLAPRVEELRAESPRLYPDRLPAPETGEAPVPAEERPATPRSLPVSIERLLLLDAAVSGTPNVRGDPSWRLSELDARGRLAGDRIEIEIETGRLELAPAEPVIAEAIRLETTGKLLAGLDGGWKVERLRLAGPPLDLEIQGSGSSTSGPLLGSLELDLTADLAALVASRTPSTHEPPAPPASLHATVDLGHRAASLTLSAPDQPAGLVKPWLSPEVAARLPLDDGRVALAADGEISLDAEGSGARGKGRVSLEIHRPNGRLAELVLRPEVLSSADSGKPAARAPFELRLLPDSPGDRTLAGEVIADTDGDGDSDGDGDTGTLSIAEAVWIVDGKIQVDQPRLGDLLEELADGFPGLVPAVTEPTGATSALAGLGPGRLQAHGTLAGPLLDPGVQADVVWTAAGRDSPEDRGSIRFKLDGRPAARTGRVDTNAQSLDASWWAEGASGALSWEGAIDADHGSLTGRLTLAGEGLSLAADGPTLDRFQLATDLAGGKAAWRAQGTATGAGPVRSFEAHGDVPDLALPLSRASLSASLGLDHPTVRGLDLGAEFASGTLQVEAQPLGLGGSDVRAGARLPLGSLARWPAAAGLRELPIERADGELTLDWTAGHRDWTELTVELTGSNRDTPLELLRAGSKGVLRVDPLRPTLSKGQIEITGLEVGAAGRRATAESLRLVIEDGKATLEPTRIDTDLGPMRLDAGLRLSPEWTLGTQPAAEPAAAIDHLTATATVKTETGRLIELLGIAAAESSGRVSIDLELAGALDDLRGTLDAASDQIAWRSSGELPVEVVSNINAQLMFDPTDIESWTGTVAVPELALTVAGRRSEIASPLRIEISDGAARLHPVRLRGETETFDLSGSVELARGGDREHSLLGRAEVDGAGTLDAALLNPWLAGGVASGPLDLGVELDLSPPGGAAEDGDFLERVTGDLRIEGATASIFFTAPYAARLTGPTITAQIQAGRASVDGELRLNEGVVALTSGTTESGGPSLRAMLDDVRFRLDHGLLARIDGDLVLADREGTPTVGGTVELERGVLTRRMDLDLDLINSLLSPVDLTTTGDDPASRIALDLELSTRDGVWIKNNIGDLRASWEPISVTGTIAAPVLEGRIDIEPGGLLFAYGQTVRLDRAAIEYPGQAGAEPRLELETTSSLEDPSIGQLAGNDLLTAKPEAFVAEEEEALDDEEETDALTGVTTGLATFWGEQIASRLSDSLGGTKISVRPVLIFGETDPGARLTLSRDVSPSFSLAASLDLRNAQRQTYLLDVHELRRLPRFNAQLFTTDLDERGATARQTLELGGGRPADLESRPRLRRLRFELPADAKKRSLKRVLGVRKGDEVGEDEIFALEIEATEYLRRRGYPDATVEAVTRVAGKRQSKLDIELEIDPGPRVEFVFEGDPPPRGLRPTITGLYRSDFYEPASLEEMRDQAVRVFRSRGHLDPRIRIDVQPGAGTPDGFDRRVVVLSESGIRVDPLAPRFEGVSGDEAAFLAARFVSPVQRTELAVGLAAADERLLDGLRMLGYSQPAIESRFSGRDDPRLTVVLRPGPRRRISSVELLGLPEDEASRLLERTGLAPGDPARGDRIALAGLAVEEELRREGRDSARVRVHSASAADNDLEIEVAFEVEPGDVDRVDDIEFAGLRSTRESWANRVADLEPGAVFRREDVAAARADLLRTGLFDSVATVFDTESGSGRLLFDVEETSRFQLAYGFRWESSEGGSAVVDFTDRNLLGRSVTLGLRALYSENDQSVRWLTTVPRPFGLRGALELFARGREETDRGVITETLESSLQYSRPIGRHSTARIYARYRDIRLTEEDPDPFFPLDERIKTPLLGFQYIYDSRGGGANPEHGIFATVDLSGAEEFLGSDFRFARFFSQLNLYRPAFRLGGRQVTWAQSYRLGIAETFGGQGLPRDQRFFAGGEYSVRGYETESLGPQETLGEFERPLGGRELLVLNHELRLPILESLDSVAFLDLGSVRGSSIDLGPGREVDNPGGLFLGIGAGLRARTPIGLLRLDLAYPLDRRDFDRTFQLYLGFGNAF